MKKILELAGFAFGAGIMLINPTIGAWVIAILSLINFIIE